MQNRLFYSSQTPIFPNFHLFFQNLLFAFSLLIFKKICWQNQCSPNSRLPTYSTYIAIITHNYTQQYYCVTIITHITITTYITIITCIEKFQHVIQLPEQLPCWWTKVFSCLVCLRFIMNICSVSLAVTQRSSTCSCVVVHIHCFRACSYMCLV